ncbi:hypothetical protein Tco_1388752 [Tanacetum coccineum]
MAFVSTPVSTDSTKDSTANLSDATVYAFLANQLNRSQFVHEDIKQIHEDDLEEMDLKWQLALLSMRVMRYYQRTGKKITINGSDTAGYDKSKVECFNCHNVRNKKSISHFQYILVLARRLTYGKLSKLIWPKAYGSLSKAHGRPCM